MLSAAGAKHLLFVLLPLCHERERACHAERRRREAPAVCSPPLCHEASELVMLSAAGAKHLLLLSSPSVTNVSELVMLSAAGAKQPGAKQILRYAQEVLRYARVPRAVLRMTTALLCSKRKEADPSLRAPTARCAQDDKPRAV